MTLYFESSKIAISKRKETNYLAFRLTKYPKVSVELSNYVYMVCWGTAKCQGGVKWERKVLVQSSHFFVLSVLFPFFPGIKYDYFPHLVLDSLSNSAFVLIITSSFFSFLFFYGNSGWAIIPYEISITSRHYDNPLNANPTKWSNTLKQLSANWRRIAWVRLTILWDWHLKGSGINALPVCF